jgi:hypothetical protein
MKPQSFVMGLSLLKIGSKTKLTAMEIRGRPARLSAASLLESLQQNILKIHEHRGFLSSYVKEEYSPAGCIKK